MSRIKSAALVRSLVQEHMDIEIATSSAFETRIMERPGRWMSPAELDAVIADLRLVGKRTLPASDLTYGVFAGDRQVFDNAIITLVYRRSDRQPIAFNALTLMELTIDNRPLEVLHLGLVMVDPNEQSRGLSWVLYGLTCMLYFLRNRLRPLWLSNVTQVPSIVGMVAETFSNVFPTPDPKAERSFLHLLIARRILEKQRHVFGVGDDAGFDEQRFVIENAYTGGSDALKKRFAEAPKHRSETYNGFCEALLDYDRGDDVLQLGQIDLNAISRYLLNDVPRSSFAAVLGSIGLLLAQRLALPIVSWLDADRSFGRLRPWQDQA